MTNDFPFKLTLIAEGTMSYDMNIFQTLLKKSTDSHTKIMLLRLSFFFFSFLKKQKLQNKIANGDVPCGIVLIAML